MGIKTANYPLVRGDLDSFRLPSYLVRNKRKIVALSTSPQLLHQNREHRYAGSKYAKLSTCRDELNKANMLYMDHRISIVMSDGKSIEQTATQELNLKSKASL